MNFLYTFAELLTLRQEYVATLSTQNNEWYGTENELQDDVLRDFFTWLNIKEQTP